MKPLFSILLPTYNRAYVLWRAIQSVLAQTEVRWELVIINDGSTDETLRVLEEFRDNRIHSFTTVNQGASAARNFGARQTSAPYLAYLDSDNTWHPDFLATMLQAIHAREDDVLWYCGQHTDIWQREESGRWTLERMQLDARAQYVERDPLHILQQVRCPVLAIFGGSDNVVPLQENVQPMREAFLASGKSNYVIEVVPEATHTFLKSPTGASHQLPNVTHIDLKHVEIIRQWLFTHIGLD